ncbi:MAG: ribose-5-phosphate isomerase RpiA [Spirochaetota bacterium]
MKETQKQMAAERAVEFVEDGMVLGLGTGSTVYYAIKKLGRMVQQGLKVKGVPTSTTTGELARSLDIPLIDLNSVDNIDLVIDGADEVDPHFNAIKGGGGALLYEKIVASSSKKVVLVVDSGKMVETLGSFPLPVEVLSFCYVRVVEKLQQKGWRAFTRKKDGGLFITDSGNVIVDLHLGKIEDPVELEVQLNLIPGVIENGLFLNMVNTVVVGKQQGAEVLHRE